MSIYAIQAVDGGPVKVGYSGSPESRLAQLQASHHAELSIVFSCEGSQADEARIHAALAHLRVRGEWFQDDPDIFFFMRVVAAGRRMENLVRAACTEAIETLGHDFDAAMLASKLHEYVDVFVSSLDVANSDFLSYIRNHPDPSRLNLDAFAGREEVPA